MPTILSNLETPRIVAVVGILVAATVLSLATYAFTASNTVAASTAGSGSNTISGYTVSSVKYNLDTDPQNIASVDFALDTAPAAGSTITIRLVAGGSDWYPCTVSGTPADDVSCTTTGATVEAANELTVVAAD